jgi:hypothetical protein
MKEIYEILNEVKAAKTFHEKRNILAGNDTPILREVIKCAYHPNAQWYNDALPKQYKPIDTLPGIAMTNLFSEMKRLYLFSKGNPTADALTPEKRNQLLTNILEGMEPNEAKVFINILQGDLDIGLELVDIKILYPDLI